jgi:hypothetical protein
MMTTQLQLKHLWDYAPLRALPHANISRLIQISKTTKVWTVRILGMMTFLSVVLVTIIVTASALSSSSSSLWLLDDSQDCGNSHDEGTLETEPSNFRLGWYSSKEDDYCWDKLVDSTPSDDEMITMLESSLRLFLGAVTLIYLCIALQLQHSLLQFGLTRCRQKIDYWERFCHNKYHHLRQSI